MSKPRAKTAAHRRKKISENAPGRSKAKSSEKKGAKKNKEKEYNPWEPKPIKPMEPIKDEFITLEGNLLSLEILGRTNSEIVIKENNKHRCLLLIYNCPFTQDETLGILDKAASHIENRKIRFSPDIGCYVVECAYSK